MSETAGVSDVVNAVSSVPGAIDAVANAPDMIPKVVEVAGRLIYGTGYTAAYLVVFPAAFVFAIIPKGNALVRGLIDGTGDAISRAQGTML